MATMAAFALLLAVALPLASGASPARSVVCIPTTMALMEKTEGRHKCSYDSELGYKAVGVGYNLDDRTPEREREVSAVFSDWDKVYDGEECLNDIQINALSTLDARRTLLKAADKIPPFHNWCCNVQAVFADLAWSLGKKEIGTGFDEVIKAAEHNDWSDAAKELEDTKWCSKHKKVCAELKNHLKDGCPSYPGAFDTIRGFALY